jgi:threonine/homoserine/homoserine lactone efflux protein
MTEALLVGAILGFFLIISVGPVIFTIIKQSINNGIKGGFSFVAGVWLSDIVLVTVSNMFSELVSDLLEYKKAIGYCGSLFLIGMGIFYLFFKKASLRKDAEGNAIRFRKRDAAKIFASGFLINTLNPVLVLTWLLYAIGFSVKYNINQRIVIFTTCILINIAADVLKVLLAEKIRTRLTVHNISVINKIAGSILAIFGGTLLYQTIYHLDKLKPIIRL